MRFKELTLVLFGVTACTADEVPADDSFGATSDTPPATSGADDGVDDGGGDTTTDGGMADSESGPPPGPVCGNDIIDGTEVCDGTDLAGATCVTLGFEVGDLMCTGNCGGYDLTGCGSFECGNGKAEGDEDCDGTVGAATCATEGYDNGTLFCTPECEYDFAQCGTCGNELIEAAEDCDVGEALRESCFSLGFMTGQLQCGDDCLFNTDGCSTCGNDMQEGTEDCDGVDIPGKTCAGEGFDSGTLACQKNCQYDFGACGTCGNDVRDGDEACDGNDFGANNCVTEGFDSGALGCDAACEITTETCGVCGNGMIDGGEACDDQLLNGVTCASLGLEGGDLACSAVCQWDFAGCDLQGFPASCQAILTAAPAATDGIYQIDPDGPMGPNDPQMVLCDMTTDGGGWTMVASTRTTTLNDEASPYYDDLQTLNPVASHTGIWDGMRAVIPGNSDIRFTCMQDPNAVNLTVDLSFYDIIWYDEISTGTDADSCFSETNGQFDDQPTPARRDNIAGTFLPVNDQWNATYLEGEDVCDEQNDFTVDFDDRGMDSNQSDGTDWGEDDTARKCGMSGLMDGAWHIWVREL